MGYFVCIIRRIKAPQQILQLDCRNGDIIPILEDGKLKLWQTDVVFDYSASTEATSQGLRLLTLYLGSLQTI